jgi:hypothetical protein
VSTLGENASPPCSSSCLPLQIQTGFGPQSAMILCCVVRGLLPLADHLLFEAMELGSGQLFLRFFQTDREGRGRALGGTAREEVKVWSAMFISGRLRHNVYLTHCAKQRFCCANITQMKDPQQERQRTLGVPPGIIYDLIGQRFRVGAVECFGQRRC